MSHLHNLRVPIVHGDFKASDVLVEVNTHQTKITNFGLYDFKGFMIRATLPGNYTMEFKQSVKQEHFQYILLVPKMEKRSLNLTRLNFSGTALYLDLYFCLIMSITKPIKL